MVSSSVQRIYGATSENQKTTLFRHLEDQRLMTEPIKMLTLIKYAILMHIKY